MDRNLLLPFLLLGSCFVLQAQQVVDVTYMEFISREELQQLNPFAQYGCDAYKISYTTSDLKGEPDTASGALFIPDQGGLGYPLLIYQHGTRRSRFDAPSRGLYEVTPYAAAMGYIGLAPDLLGMGDSRGFHPYVHAASAASAAIDMLLAVKAYLIQQDIPFSDQLFVTGYSQGGHSAAALQRAIETGQAGDLTVTAAAHMSGPYSISGEMAGLLFRQDEEYFFPAFFGNAYLSYNDAYGLYDSTQQVFREPYASMIDSFYTRWESGLDSLGFDFLNDQMKDSLLAREGGIFLPPLFQDSILQILASEPGHPLSLALQDNDVYDWTPLAPTRLYYCRGDDRIPFANSTLADSVMRANGAVDILALDVGTTLDHDECVIPAGTQMVLFFEEYKDITGTRQLARLPGVKAYPNPAAENLYLTALPRDSRIRIFSPDGRLVAEEIARSSPATLQLNALPPGLYILQVLSRGGSWTGQVVVDR